MRLDQEDRHAGKAERKGDRHANDEQADKNPEQDHCGLSGRKNIAAHCFAPSKIRISSTICSPANTIHVTPATGQATWISQSGRSASSDVRFQANRVNSIPAHTKTSAIASTPSRARIRTMASLRRDRSGQTSTSKCCASLMPTIAPIMTVQKNRKSAIDRKRT